MLENLNDIGERIRIGLEEKNQARDKALVQSRELIRHCAHAIRAIHRLEFDQAQTMLARARSAAKDMVQRLADYPDLYYAGYTQDALKELAEAHITCALVKGQPLPDPGELQVENAAYLNGLAEAAGEMRRYALDLIRRDEVEKSEGILDAMNDIYSLLVTIDFPDAITGGLRRTTDVTRSILERTRGDLTMSLRQERLQKALGDFEKKMSSRLDDNA